VAGITYPYGDSTARMDALLSTSLQYYYKKGAMEDAIFKSNPLFYMLHSGKKVKKVGGGYKIAVNLMYGKNTTVGSYSRYELLDIAPQDGMTQAHFPWAQYSGAISIDGLSEFQNAGPGKLKDLVGEKVQQTTMTFADTMNEHMFDVANVTVATATTGNSGKNLLSLPILVFYNSTGAANSIGGIDANTYNWWGNQFTDYGGSHTAVIFKGKLSTTYNACQKGSIGGGPDTIVMDQTSWEIYERAMDPQIRYTDDETASAGFDTLRYKRAKVFWDEHACDPEAGQNWDNPPTAGVAYFLNTKFLKLMVGKGKDFAPTKFTQPEDQDARTAKYLFYGQLVTSNRRKQGVLFGINKGAFS